MKVVQFPIAELKELEGNVRFHPEEQIEALRDCILTMGWLVPILIGEDGTILAGHGRVEAARRIGLDTVPAIRCPPDWSDERKFAFSVADNRLAEMSEWDLDTVRREMEYLGSQGFDDLLGLSYAKPSKKSAAGKGPVAGPMKMGDRKRYKVVCAGCGKSFTGVQ